MTGRETPRPDLRQHVALCMSCEHWQVDVRPSSIRDLGGWVGSMKAIALAHHEHLSECPGAGGRVKFNGQWVEPPRMQSGKPADGTLAMMPLPRWWVAR